MGITTKLLGGEMDDFNSAPMMEEKESMDNFNAAPMEEEKAMDDFNAAPLLED